MRARSERRAVLEIAAALAVALLLAERVKAKDAEYKPWYDDEGCKHIVKWDPDWQDYEVWDIVRVHGKVKQSVETIKGGPYNGYLRVRTTWHGPPAGNHTTDPIDPIADYLTKVRFTLKEEQILYLDATAADADESPDFDPESDICTQGFDSCETWDGDPLEPGWSIVDPNGMATQVDGRLLVTGMGAGSPVEIVLPAGMARVILDNVDARGNPSVGAFKVEFFFMDEITQEEFLGLVEYLDYDCNGNLVPDECDVDCGTLDGLCGLYPSCGDSLDENANGIPDECDCRGDLDGDGDTDQSDLGIMLSDWGCSGGECSGDLDGDGDTDQSDLGVLLSDWGCEY